MIMIFLIKGKKNLYIWVITTQVSSILLCEVKNMKYLLSYVDSLENSLTVRVQKTILETYIYRLDTVAMFLSIPES